MRQERASVNTVSMQTGMHRGDKNVNAEERTPTFSLNNEERDSDIVLSLIKSASS